MKGQWHKYLVYTSLLFLLLALYTADYLKIPQIYHYNNLVLSFLFLCVGATCQGLVWYATLYYTEYKASFQNCLAGVGLSIFTKYIPGKVFIVLGRAAYTARVYNYPTTKLSLLSLHAQFIAFWVGISVGSLYPLFNASFEEWGIIIISAWFLLTLIVFSKQIHLWIARFVEKFFKKTFPVLWLDAKTIFRVLPAFFTPWLFFSIGFYFLVISLTNHPIPFSIGYAFALATTAGIMALIVPGGIGVREGVLVGFLVLAGLSTSEATGIAVTSRLWFLIGEVYVFLVGWLMDRKLKKQLTNPHTTF